MFAQRAGGISPGKTRCMAGRRRSVHRGAMRIFRRIIFQYRGVAFCALYQQGKRLWRRGAPLTVFSARA